VTTVPGVRFSILLLSLFLFSLFPSEDERASVDTKRFPERFLLFVLRMAGEKEMLGRVKDATACNCRLIHSSNGRSSRALFVLLIIIFWQVITEYFLLPSATNLNVWV